MSTYSGPWNNNTIGGVAETLSLHNLEAEKSGSRLDECDGSCKGTCMVLPGAEGE